MAHSRVESPREFPIPDSCPITEQADGAVYLSNLQPASKSPGMRQGLRVRRLYTVPRGRRAACTVRRGKGPQTRLQRVLATKCNGHHYHPLAIVTPTVVLCFLSNGRASSGGSGWCWRCWL